MHIFIMRHGEAEQFQVNNDKQRNLTTLGERQSEAAGDWIKTHCSAAELELALVSPYVRTQQTFNALTRSIEVTSSQLNADLVPSGNAQLVHDYLDVLLMDKKVKNTLLMVSHMPLVSYLLDSLLQQHQSLLFATAAVALVEYDSKLSKGRLVDLYHPD